MSADDFLPVLTYSIIFAPPSHLLRTLEVMRLLIDPEEAVRQTGYFSASFQAAVEHIIDLVKAVPSREED